MKAGINAQKTEFGISVQCTEHLAPAQLQPLLTGITLPTISIFKY